MTTPEEKDVEYVGNIGSAKPIRYIFAAVALTVLFSAIALINSIIGVTDHPTCSSTIVHEGDDSSTIVKGGVKETLVTSIADGPCSDYDNFVYVSPDDDWTFCASVLREDTAYILTGHINCNGNEGPTLASNTCLDCRGFLIKGEDLYGPSGLQFLTVTEKARVHNCIIRGFHVGISIKGHNNDISHVETTNNVYGIQSLRSAGPNSVTCSVSRNNFEGGMDIKGSLEISGSLVESNKNNEGIILSDSAIVSCSEVRSDKIKILGDGDRKIQNSVAPSIEFTRCASGTTSLDNVVLCGTVTGRGAWEEMDSYDEYDEWDHCEGMEETMQSENTLTCNVRALPEYAKISCDKPCPADLSSVSLPPECSEVCPVERGTYIPM